MRRIEIDDEVFACLQSHAVPYVDTPNDTLRRLLPLESKPNATASTSTSEEPLRSTPRRQSARKRAKANLGALISAGVLQNGQKLFLHDYQGNRIRGAEATIGGHGIWPSDKSRLYSMSDLAQELLKKEGYRSDSVRGPSHWHTVEGKSVTQLWDEYLINES